MSNTKSTSTILITGGTDGIGRALVFRYLSLGWNVITCGRNPQKILELEQDAPKGNLCVLNADVSIEKDCERLVNHAIKMFGRLDVLINNAGISMRGMLEEGKDLIGVVKKVMDINFNGALYCTTYALPHMIESKGVIVGVSSVAGYRGLPGRSGYSASKFALQGFLESIKVELVDKGVHVMWVSPGFIASNIRFNSLDAEGKSRGSSTMNESKLMTPERCAELIANGIAKRKRTVLMSFKAYQTVFLNKFFPSLTDKLVRNFYFKNGKLIK